MNFNIIPAIDIIEGKCVRLTKGDYSTRKVYYENPLDVALSFQEYGFKRLHIVDLDGAKAKHLVNYKVVEQIASRTHFEMELGGGIKTNEDVKIAFLSGVHKIIVGSIAATNPETVALWLAAYGSNKIILGADVQNRKIAIHGWEELTALDLISFVQSYQNKGIKEVICTDISKDGMLQGPAFALYEEILTQTQVQLIASGGVSSIEDIEKLEKMGCSSVIVGKAIYENKISLKDLKAFQEKC